MTTLTHTIPRNQYQINDLVVLVPPHSGHRLRSVHVVSRPADDVGMLELIDYQGTRLAVHQDVVLPATPEDGIRFADQSLLFLENAYQDAKNLKCQRLHMLERYFRSGEEAKDLLRAAGYGSTGASLLDTVRAALADLERLGGTGGAV